MGEPVIQLMLHGAILLLIGLLAGIPYRKAIVSKEEEHITFSWRVAHSALTMIDP